MFDKKDLNRLLKVTLTFVLLLFVSSNIVFAQKEEEKKEKKTTSEIVLTPFALSDISNQSENLAIRISKLKQILKLLN